MTGEETHVTFECTGIQNVAAKYVPPWVVQSGTQCWQARNLGWSRFHPEVPCSEGASRAAWNQRESTSTQWELSMERKVIFITAAHNCQKCQRIHETKTTGSSSTVSCRMSSRNRRCRTDTSRASTGGGCTKGSEYQGLENHRGSSATKSVPAQQSVILDARGAYVRSRQEKAMDLAYYQFIYSYFF